MKRLVIHASTRLRLATIQDEGAQLPQFQKFCETLCRGRPLPDYSRDHDLKGKLKGFRSCVVGYHTVYERNVVMVYQVTTAKIHILIVEEHDRAYEIALDVQK